MTSRILPPAMQKALGTESLAEAVLLNRIRELHLPEPQTQVQLISWRKYRYDFAWPEYKIAVELQGGVHGNESRGRHTRGAGYEEDCTKLALAQIAGYACLYLTPGMVDKGTGGMLLLEMFKARGWRQ